MDKAPPKPVVWVGSSHEIWRTFPDDVQDVMGYALHLAQCGEKTSTAKPLVGFKGASVLEIIDDYDGNTYRAVYTVRFQGVVYLKFRSSLAAIQLGVGWVRRAHLNPSRIASPDERVVTQHNGQFDHRCWVTTRIAYRVVDSFWRPCASNPTYSPIVDH